MAPFLLEEIQGAAARRISLKVSPLTALSSPLLYTSLLLVNLAFSANSAAEMYSTTHAEGSARGNTASATTGIAGKLGEALIGGKFSLWTRYRFEHVDQDGLDEKANASTVKNSLRYQTDNFYGASLLLEFENVSRIGAKDFNDTRNGKPQFPVVADPPVSEINQAFLQYTRIPETELKLGRQHIALDDHRFVGNVDWRQNEQSFDGLRIDNNVLPKTTLMYAYLLNQRTVTHQTNDMSSHLIHAHHTSIPYTELSLYAYLLDFDYIPTNSSQSYGLRLLGDYPINETISLLYTGEYAYQADFDANPNELSNSYYLLDGGIGLAPRGIFDAIKIRMAYAVLQGQGTDPNDPAQQALAFQTPLATLHAFQGWGDKFLRTPGPGIEDIYSHVGAGIHGVNLLFVYHRFNSDRADFHYGDEYDASIVKTWKKAPALRDYSVAFTLGAKYAFYVADEFATDTHKVWAWAELKF